jgi:hypothetical protein
LYDIEKSCSPHASILRPKVYQMYIKCIPNVYHLYAKIHLIYYRYAFDILWIYYGKKEKSRELFT